MAKSPQRTCPNLFRLIEHADPDQIDVFLTQDEFSRLTWLQKHLSKGGDTSFDGLVENRRKPQLAALEDEAARVLTVSEMRGQFALDGLVREKLKVDQLEQYRKQKDDLCRSLWVYIHHRTVFDAVESVLHHRLYRRYGKHYQAFSGYASTVRADADAAGQIQSMIADI